LDAVTVARLLREKAAPPSAPQLWIVDEAGLLSIDAMARLLRQTEAVQAKVLLVGDRRQHHAVEACRPFAQLVEAGLRIARLEQIERQRDKALRAVGEQAARGEAARAVAALDRQGRLVERLDRSERLDAAVARYMQADGSALVVTARNADRQRLNQPIREARIAAGQVERASVQVSVAVAKA
jgi:ATP-dependent exoDNAse (exonuclease V) alpha subunit